MPTARRVPPSVVDAARAAQGIPQSGAIPAPSVDIASLLAALKGGGSGMNTAALMQLLALLLGSGSAPQPMAQQSSPIEEAFMAGGGGYGQE